MNLFIHIALSLVALQSMKNASDLTAVKANLQQISKELDCWWKTVSKSVTKQNEFNVILYSCTMIVLM